MADYDKAFSQTGAGSGDGTASSEADAKKARKDNLKDLTDVFSKKNLFGKEKPAEEATQKAVLEQTLELQQKLAAQVEHQQKTESAAASIFTIVETQEKARKKLQQDQAENEFEQNQALKDQADQQEQSNKLQEKQVEEQKEQTAQGAERGSMIGKLGGAMAGAGIAAAGLGVALFASAKAMKEFQDVDAGAVADNVKEILTLVPSAGGGNLLSFFAEGGTLALVLAGLGIGLGVFGVGSAAAGAATEFVGFDAETIKQNVLTLLSIGDEAGGNLEFLIDSAFFAAAMTGLAAGLAVFGAGAAVGSSTQGIAEGVAMFTGTGELFAQQIKDNVLILLSIKDSLGGNLNMLMDGGAFLLAMTGIGLGLAVFGAGAAAAGAGQGVAEGVAKFTGTGDLFAQQIKDNVLILLSIGDEIAAKGGSFIGDSADFLLAMSGIGAGLAVFGVGSAVAGVGSGLANFMSKDGNFAQDIYDRVETLMSIAKEHPDLRTKSANVKYALEQIGAGIASFGSDGFSNALSNFGSSVVEFFTIGGPKPTPLDIAMKVADKGDQLKNGAEGMRSLAGAFNRLANVSSNNDFKMHPDAIDNLTAFSNAMNRFAGGEYEKMVTGVEGTFMGVGTETVRGKNRLNAIDTVASAFHNLADGMDRVSDSAVRMNSVNLDGLGMTLAGNPAGNTTQTVIVNQGSNINTSQQSTIISGNLTDSTSTAVTENN